MPTYSVNVQKPHVGALCIYELPHTTEQATSQFSESCCHGGKCVGLHASFQECALSSRADTSARVTGMVIDGNGGRALSWKGLEGSASPICLFYVASSLIILMLLRDETTFNGTDRDPIVKPEQSTSLFSYAWAF